MNIDTSTSNTGTDADRTVSTSAESGAATVTTAEECLAERVTGVLHRLTCEGLGLSGVVVGFHSSWVEVVVCDRSAEEIDLLVEGLGLVDAERLLGVEEVHVGGFSAAGRDVPTGTVCEEVLVINPAADLLGGVSLVCLRPDEASRVGARRLVEVVAPVLFSGAPPF